MIEYLALPYIHENGFVLHSRALVSDTIAAALVKEGRIVYAPISSWHHIAINHKIDGDWKTWQKFDHEFLKVSKKLLVIKIKGWEKSVGVKAEIKLAEELGIPVEYLDPIQYGIMEVVE